MAATEYVLEVVTYDPVTRKGFLRACGGVLQGRVHFALGMMPEAFKRPVIERSRPINSKRGLSPEDLHALIREIRRSVTGVRLHAHVRLGDDGRRHLVPRTITIAP
jgi:hypothetical protein